MFGLTDLIAIRGKLEELYKRVPFTLTIVSNDREAYKQYIGGLSFDSTYREWSEDAVLDEFRKGPIVLLPASPNPFSACKSANRALLALQNGVPVIASSGLSLSGLEGAVLFEDWENSILRYLQEPALVKEHLSRAAVLFEKEYSVENYINRWEKLFEELVASKGGALEKGV